LLREIARIELGQDILDWPEDMIQSRLAERSRREEHEWQVMPSLESAVRYSVFTSHNVFIVSIRGVRMHKGLTDSPTKAPPDGFQPPMMCVVMSEE